MNDSLAAIPHVAVFANLNLVDILIQATVVQKNDQECVQGSYGVIWLFLFNIAIVGVDQKQALTKLDVVDATNEIIFATADDST